MFSIDAICLSGWKLVKGTEDVASWGRCLGSLWLLAADASSIVHYCFYLGDRN